MDQNEERNWTLVRNNNGEWICSEQVVFDDSLEIIIYTLRAKQYNLPLSPQTYYGSTWYYNREIEALKAAIDEPRINELEDIMNIMDIMEPDECPF